MGTVILMCGCGSTPSGNPAAALFQDATHGRGKRAHNVRRALAGKTPEARCTVCTVSREVPKGTQRAGGARVA